LVGWVSVLFSGFVQLVISGYGVIIRTIKIHPVFLTALLNSFSALMLFQRSHGIYNYCRARWAAKELPAAAILLLRARTATDLLYSHPAIFLKPDGVRDMETIKAPLLAFPPPALIP
jgi:hypothetical protein